MVMIEKGLKRGEGRRGSKFLTSSEKRDIFSVHVFYEIDNHVRLRRTFLYFSLKTINQRADGHKLHFQLCM